MRKTKESKNILYKKILIEIKECIFQEMKNIEAGEFSRWRMDYLTDVVYPEIDELILYAREDKIYFRHGKKQRRLHSMYLIVDSYVNLDDTVLGKKICELQEIYNKL